MKKLALTCVSLIALNTAASAQDSGYYQEYQQPAYPAGAEYYQNHGMGGGMGGYQDSYQEPAPQTVQPAHAARSDSDMFFTGDVSALTDYRVRGVSRSDGPALQGNAKLNYRGAYAGVSASTVDMNIDKDAWVETTFFGGYKGKHDSGIDYDARLSYNAYPGGDNDDMDYLELTLTGGYDFDVFYGALTWAISPDYINDSGVTLYYGADITAPVPVGGLDLNARAHLGFQFIGDDNKYVDDNAMDWLLGVYYREPSYGVDLGVAATGTNLDDNDCTEDCGSQLMLSAGKSFGW